MMKYQKLKVGSWEKKRGTEIKIKTKRKNINKNNRQKHGKGDGRRGRRKKYGFSNDARGAF